jgi:hypothetical protein
MAAGVSGCGKTNPPLIPADKVAALAALQSPYASLVNDASESGVPAGATDLMVLKQGEALRLSVITQVRDYVGVHWPEHAARPSTDFAGFERPQVACPAPSTDGEVCTLTFVPRGKAESINPLLPVVHLNLPPAERARLTAEHADTQAPRTGVTTVRLDIDAGGNGQFLRPPTDRRPLLAPGAPATRIVSGELVFERLGRQAVVCRLDRSPGATWERRNCTIERGALRMTVGRDAYLPGAPATSAAFSDVGADPDMLADLRSGAQLFVEVLKDPALMRALPPMRYGNDPGAVIFSVTGQPTVGDTPDIRDKAAANSAQLAWHDVVDQREFNTLCLDAAAKRKPLLIYTADGASNIQRFIYDNQFKLIAPHAMLVIVRMFPEAGESAWAEGFADAIGAGRWSALTVTDKPKWSHDACQIGKVYQGAAGKVHPADVLRALLTGKLPTG